MKKIPPIGPAMHPTMEELARILIAGMSTRGIEKGIKEFTDEGIKRDIIELMYEELNKRS